ncbi:helix-turn-helix domain-containing protein [Methanotorris igneus]|uniref:Helix-turn-helix domain protein n=1 Tax=Methanotorris igneus (strain DSM 5666 / JCM 11834 / Kol 5) TaxID=880724 RepID=F6BBD4_METIK|nr:helix-turn-helix transcriptional regulator [Methanotorris igneus]AEF97141.1 helix-turn-helix domain protein [Methanotorris igneus Kol 5]
MYKKLNIIERAILLNPKYVKIFREKLNITQSKLAEESGVSQSHLSMLEKGKRKATEMIAAAITLGLLKCSDVWDKEDPIMYLLDILSLTKLEEAIVEFINDINNSGNSPSFKRFVRYIEGYPVIVVDKDAFTEELKKRLDVIEIKNIEFKRGCMTVKGLHSDKREVVIDLDCSDIRRLEKKVSEKINKKTIIQIFPKDETPPIYSVNRDCMIVHCWG